MKPRNVMQQQVNEFTSATKNPIVAKAPGTWPNQMTKDLCYKLIKEEVVEELLPAIENDDWEEIIDGGCDSLYVIFYLFSKIGIDAQFFFDEVHRTNMAKLDGPLHPETGKQMKPEGWEPPRIKELLALVREEHKKRPRL